MPGSRQTRKLRPSPSESATSLPEGTIRRGGNKRRWVIKKMNNGVHRWIPAESAELNGIKLLTVNSMENKIGKEIRIYLREYSDAWPSHSEFEPEFTFIPDGHARINNNKRLLENWLHTRNPPVKKGQYFYITGIGTYDGSDKEFDTLQVESKNGEIVSPNLINTEAFVLSD
jgi:hypothetical protein